MLRFWLSGFWVPYQQMFFLGDPDTVYIDWFILSKACCGPLLADEKDLTQ